MVPSAVFTIFLGNDKTMNLKTVYAENLSPLDLTLCTEIDIALPAAAGGFLHRLLSLTQVVITSPPVLGQFTALIPASVSSLLNVGELQSFDVTFTISSQKTTVKYMNALSVFQL